MAKVLFISDNEEKIKELEKILVKNSHEFFSSNEKTMIFDILKVEAPEILVLDKAVKTVDLKVLSKKFKSIRENIITIILSETDDIPQELLKNSDAFLLEPVSKNLLVSTINSNLRTKNSLELLSNSNQELAQSLYQLNVLYSTSSQFAGTLEKDKLIDIMIEGLDKSLGFSLCCVLNFRSEFEPVLIIHSLYKISDRLLEALKLRAVLNYKSLFENKKIPFELNIDNLICEKHIKNAIDEYDFSILRYDNMFSSISLTENFFGFVEIYRESEFTSEDMKCFQTIAQQVSLPLKNASLYQEIKETNKKLEKLERLKSEFISIVSHELRTPLAVIKTNVESIKRFFTIQEKMLPLVDRIISNITRLSGIINDLLDFSKIEAGKMDYKFAVIKIDTVIEYVKTSLQGLANSKNLKINLELEDNLAYIFADAKRLEQVLINLVQNAIKFTPEGKNITIKTCIKDASKISSIPFADELKHLKGKYLIVCVADEGIGIPDEDLKHVFDKFEQIENSLSREAGGTGLGLSITRQLLDAHNGAIWCDSDLSKGSNFYFAIPLTTEKNNFWILHKQMINQAKANHKTFATVLLSGETEVIDSLLKEENLINRNYLNISLLEKEDDKSILTLVIQDGDRNSAKLLKQKIDDVMVNNKTRYSKYDIIYSYTIHPEGNS